MTADATMQATKRLKYGVELRRDRVDGQLDERPYIGLEHIQPAVGRLVVQKGDATSQVHEESFSGDSVGSAFSSGDVLFGKLRPYLAKVWVADFPGRCSTELLVMQPVDFLPNYLKYVCLSDAFVSAVDASTFGSKMPRADWDFIGALKVPTPSQDTQLAVTRFLDREVTRLDSLIEGKQRLLDLLAEKRRALITHAVTRGLDPNAPLCDSGLPWLGHIPQDWSIQRLKFLVNGIEQGWSPECHNVPASAEEWGVLKAGCCNGGIFNSEENKALPNDLTPPLTLEVMPGDVLMSRASGSVELIGSTALVPGATRPKLLLSDKVYRLEIRRDKIDARYLVLLLGSAVGRLQVQLAVSGAAGLANNIAQSDINEFLLPVPPLIDQIAILEHLDSQTTKLDALQSVAKNTIALLKERRAALIGSAVTGKLDNLEAA